MLCPIFTTPLDWWNVHEIYENYWTCLRKHTLWPLQPSRQWLLCVLVFLVLMCMIHVDAEYAVVWHFKTNRIGCLSVSLNAALNWVHVHSQVGLENSEKRDQVYRWNFGVPWGSVWVITATMWARSRYQCPIIWKQSSAELNLKYWLATSWPINTCTESGRAMFDIC